MNRDVNSLGFIGSGNMAQALIKGLTVHGKFKPESIYCISKSGTSARGLAEEYGIKVAGSLEELLKHSDTIIVAVKPAQLKEISKTLSDESSGKLIISLLAGVEIEDLNKLCPQARNIIRAMPNTPVQINMGVTGYTAKQKLEDRDRLRVNEIFKSVGITIEVKESELDGLTAISGCGPAYVYELARCMIEGGVASGLNRDLAQKLTEHTIRGAAELMLKTNESVENLIKEVASPGGLTEKALNEMRRLGLPEAIKCGILAVKL